MMIRKDAAADRRPSSFLDLAGTVLRLRLAFGEATLRTNGNPVHAERRAGAAGPETATPFALSAGPAQPARKRQPRSP
jgi:hypothetical protein